MPACLHACLSACLPACLFIYLFVQHPCLHLLCACQHPGPLSVPVCAAFYPTGGCCVRPASGVDLSDPDQLTYGSVGLPADLLPAGCPEYPGVDADFAQAPMLTYVPAM